jgi:serine protease inhibitor
MRGATLQRESPSPAASPTLQHVRLDRPFLFALRDLDTGAVLFLGQVIDPTQA